jgi:hypothetical protein
MGTHSNSFWGPISWNRRAFELHHSSGADGAAAADDDEQLSLFYFDVDPALPQLTARISALKLAEKSSRDFAAVQAQRVAAEAELAQRKAKALKGEFVLLKGATTFQVV